MKRATRLPVAAATALVLMVGVVPAALASPEPTPPATTTEQRFEDVPASNQFQRYIHWMAAEGISTGWIDGTFRPNATIERQAMAAFIYRAAATPGSFEAVTTSFRDVRSGELFHSYVEWMSFHGISLGHFDGTFRPLESVSREAMAAFLFRVAGCPEFTPPARPSFSDVNLNAHFRHEIEWLAATGISTGWPDGTFRPSLPVERQAMAAFIYRANAQGLFNANYSRCAHPAPDLPSWSEAEQRVFNRTNEYRSENGTGQLTWNNGLAAAARIHARAMHDRGCLWHFGFVGQGGGNAAMSSSSQADFVRLWSGSPGHRTNMLRATHTVIGVGVYSGPNGTYAYQIMAAQATPRSTWRHQPGTPGLMHSSRPCW
ncbi:MAG: S-layer homology domain-containing protein [Promicromonosporaceae bacterium]|nr:S-layer homology domain-containing protein [Promicromonosporaceae bacterium]